MSYFLAIDIGASSGRHMLGHIVDGRMELEEIYRFDNGLTRKNGHLCWDTENLFKEIKKGLKVCSSLGKTPISLGIDTWGVDFVLLDKDENILGDTVGYRDDRTEGMEELVADIIADDDLYSRTGIQSQRINTIYQLMAIKKQNPELLDRAESMLFYPDYFSYLLTGKKLTEYTNASTSGLLNAKTKNWDFGLIDRLGLKREILKDIHMPMTELGGFCKEVVGEVGFYSRVVLPASHDTGSAVLAVPAKDDDFVYISSGTWSLMGIESQAPNLSIECMKNGFTNEGGFDGRFRILKNIMGLWMIQSVKGELNNEYSFDELCALAKEANTFPSRVEVNDDCFLSPKSMIKEIKNYCARTGQRVPETVGEISACIYQSLADSYSSTVSSIESITGRNYSRIHIVGGGSKDIYLNELTAKATGKDIYTGPAEATSIGNLTALMIKHGEFSSVDEARNCIYDSFDINKLEKAINVGKKEG